MTENKLKKYLKIPLPPQTGAVNKTTKHIVLSDSKAGYLRSQSSDASECLDIVWWYRSLRHDHGGTLCPTDYLY